MLRVWKAPGDTAVTEAHAVRPPGNGAVRTTIARLSPSSRIIISLLETSVREGRPNTGGGSAQSTTFTSPHAAIQAWPFPQGKPKGPQGVQNHLSVLCRKHRCCSSANSLIEHEIRSQSLCKSSSNWPPFILGKDNGYQNQV